MRRSEIPLAALVSLFHSQRTPSRSPDLALTEDTGENEAQRLGIRANVLEELELARSLVSTYLAKGPHTLAGGSTNFLNCHK